MSRTVATPLLLLAALVWLLVGLLVAAVLASVLHAGLSADDPRRDALTVAAVLLGLGVALVGFTVTRWLATRRAADSRPPGSVAVNTLRGDAVQRPRAAFGRMASPVPPVSTKRQGGPGAMRTWKPGAPPPPAPTPPWNMSAGSRAESRTGAWARPPDGRTAALRTKGTIPGAQTVATARSARTAAAVPTRRGAPVAAAALSLIAGLVPAYAQVSGGTIDLAVWAVSAGLLVVAGILAAATPWRRGFGPGVLGLLAAVPILAAGLDASATRGFDPVAALGVGLLAALGAGVLLRFGAMLGGGTRRSP